MDIGEKSKSGKDNTSISVDVERIGSVDRHLIKTGFNDFNDLVDEEKYGGVKRKLTGRHLSTIIIGSSIGTGLFIGIKSPFQHGSLSLFLGFIIWACLNVYPLMLAVGEMGSYLPIKGSFIHFAARWVDPALGFACTIIYVYTCLMFICVELTGFSSCIGYFTDVNPGVFIAVGLVTIFVFNTMAVNFYGEIEFVATFLKIFLIIGLMLFSLISMCGGNPKHNAYGFQHWTEGGLFRPYLVGGATGKFLGWWNTLIYAAFACGGADILSLVAFEVSQPRKSMGIAAKRSYVRIYLFYFGGIFFMNCLIASNDKNLTNATELGLVGAAASPWVIGIRNVGVHGLDALVNVLIISAAWSCGNAFTYSATRSIYSGSLAGYLPRFFSKCLKNGCPIYCVLFAMLVGCLSFLNVKNSTNVVLNWFINLATTGMICTYTVIWLNYFKFRKALKAQDKEDEFNQGPYYKMPKFIRIYFTPFAFLLNNLVLVFNGFWVFFPGNLTVANLFTSYFAPVFFVIVYFGWKILKKTHIRTNEEADITTGKSEIDDEEEMERQFLETKVKRKGFFWSCWYKFSAFAFE